MYHKQIETHKERRSTSVRFDAEIFEKIEKYSVERGISFTETIHDILRKGLPFYEQIYSTDYLERQMHTDISFVRMRDASTRLQETIKAQPDLITVLSNIKCNLIRTAGIDKALLESTKRILKEAYSALKKYNPTIATAIEPDYKEVMLLIAFKENNNMSADELTQMIQLKVRAAQN